MNIECGKLDPHLPLPATVVESAPAISKAVRVAGNIFLVAAIVVDGVRLGKDISEDVRNGKASVRTAKTAASIAGGWTGSALGGESCLSFQFVECLDRITLVKQCWFWLMMGDR